MGGTQDGPEGQEQQNLSGSSKRVSGDAEGPAADVDAVISDAAGPQRDKDITYDAEKNQQQPQEIREQQEQQQQEEEEQQQQEEEQQQQQEEEQQAREEQVEAEGLLATTTDDPPDDPPSSEGRQRQLSGPSQQQEAGTSKSAAAEGAEGSQGGRGPKPKLQRPDGVQPCPRCDSRDTKFCYYNNYNIKQPRYFCRACQRYWTAGGALRDVPVGAGRRKSKVLKAEPSTPAAVSVPLLAQPDHAAAAAAGVATLPLPATVLSHMPGLMLDPGMAQAYMEGAKPGLLPPAAAAALPPAILPPGLPQVHPYSGMMAGGPAGLGALPVALPPVVAATTAVPALPAKIGDSLSKLAANSLLGQAAPPDSTATEPQAGMPRGLSGGDSRGLLGNGLPGAFSAPQPPLQGEERGEASAPTVSEDGAVDGRRTRLKAEQPAEDNGGPPPVLQQQQQPLASAAMLPPSLSTLANAGLAGGLAGAFTGGDSGSNAAGLAAATAGLGVAHTASSSFVMPGASGLYGAGGTTARFGGAADTQLGPTHLGTAGPLSSEFFAAAAAAAAQGAPPQHVGVAMHPQAAALAAAAASPGVGGALYMPPPYGSMAGMWPYSPLGGTLGTHGWPNGHPHAAQVAHIPRYPSPYGSLPHMLPPGGAAAGLGGAFGAPAAVRPAGALTPADVAQALAQVPAGAHPAAHLGWLGVTDINAVSAGGGSGGGWSNITSLAGGINAITSGLHPQQQQQQFQQQLLPPQQQALPLGFGPMGGYGGLAASTLSNMVPTSGAIGGGDVDGGMDRT